MTGRMCGSGAAMSNSSERPKPLGFDLRARIAAALAEAQETHNGIGDLALADAVIRELQLTVLGDGIVVGVIHE